MAAASMLEIQVNAIKMGNCHRILMQIGTQTKKHMLSLKVTIQKRKHRSIFKMAAAAILLIEANDVKWELHPISMKFDTQT
jgi:hypothetical protein